MQTGRALVWLVPPVLWLGFTAWYTDLGGPLTKQEVDEGLATFKANGMEGQQFERLEQFLLNDTGNQFLMINNIDVNEDPPPMDGFDEDATASDYISHYMEHMFPQLLRRACHPVFLGSTVAPALDLLGIENASDWDQAALFRYRSRRSFLEVITHPDMGTRHNYKLAGMTKTIAYPVEPQLYTSDLRFQLFLFLTLITALLDIFLFGRKSS